MFNQVYKAKKPVFELDFNVSLCDGWEPISISVYKIVEGYDKEYPDHSLIYYSVLAVRDKAL